MTPGELLHKLEQTGIEFKTESGKLKVRGPLTDELRELIRQHKPKILAELQRRELDKFKSNPEPPRTLKRRSIVKIRSGTLDGEIIYFAKDKQAIAKAPGGVVVYILEELAALLAEPVPDRESLRQIHQCKKLFGGIIIKEGKGPWEKS